MYHSCEVGHDDGDGATNQICIFPNSVSVYRKRILPRGTHVNRETKGMICEYAAPYSIPGLQHYNLHSLGI
jgi:hypothetical protein